jgi:transcriptional regulator with XRE-family HTH domain
MDLSRQEIAQRIRDAQANAPGVTWARLAVAANISTTMMGYIKNAERRAPASVILAIAKELGIDPTELDPSLQSRFRETASWYLDALSEAQGIYRAVEALTLEVVERQDDLVSASKVHQQYCRQVQLEISERTEKLASLQQLLNAKQGKMRRELKTMEAIAQYVSDGLPGRRAG